MLLLDPADVPLHVAKLFKYVADARKNELKKMSRNGSSNDDKKSAMATQRAIAVGKRCQFMADVFVGRVHGNIFNHEISHVSIRRLQFSLRV